LGLKVPSLKNFRTSTKLTLMTMVILLLPIFSLVYLALQVRDGTDQINNTTKAIENGSVVIENQAKTQAEFALVTDVAYTFSQLQYWLCDLALSLQNGSEEQAEEKQSQLNQLLTRMASIDSQWAQSLRSEIDQYIETMFSAVDAYTDDNRVLGNSLVSESRRKSTTIETELQNLLSAAIASTKEAEEKIALSNKEIIGQNLEVIKRNESIFRLSVILPVVATVVGLLFSIITARSLSRPLATMVERVKDLAEGEGDLTKRIELDRKDEIGELGLWFDQFVQQIHDIIAEVVSVTGEMTIATTSISTSSRAMANGMVDQNDQVLQIAKAMDEMSSSVADVARKSGDASHNAETSGNVAQEGGRVVNETIAGMTLIRDAVEAGAASVKTLGDRSEQIGQMVDVINDIADRKIDLHVARTAERPLTSGKVTKTEALLLFFVLVSCAFVLVLQLNLLTIYISFAALALASVYPYMKRHTHLPQVVLGMAFACSVPMAFAAQTDTIPREAWLIFVLTVVWTVIYDTMYAMVDRDDDLKIGVKSTAILFGDADKIILAFAQILLIFGFILLGSLLNLNQYYFMGVTVASCFFIYQQYLIKDRDKVRCLSAFLNNNWFGLSIYLGIIGNYSMPGLLN